MTDQRSVAILSIGLGKGGGAEVQIVRLARALRERGWRVAVVTLLAPEAYEAELRAAGVEVTSVRLRGRRPDPRPLLRLVAYLRRARPDALVTFMFHANVIGRVAGRLAGVPVVVSSVRTDRFGGALRYWLLGATDRWADVTTANSRFVADDLVRRGFVRPERMRVTPNAFTVPESGPSPAEVRALRASLGAEDGDFLWLAVGNLAWRKDYPTLLRAVKLLGAGAGKVRVAGHGPDAAAVKALAAELGVDDRVGFLGFRGDVALLMHAADALVSSSSAEGMPNAIAEALAVGKPVVATRVGGTPELVAEGVSGFMAPVGDPEALAAAMRRLMALDPAARAAMGAAGRAHVASVHQPERVADQWESLLLELVGRKPRRR
ncbi:MAG TPA: glycosyltransferase [Longimicrobium sp.]|nr:glycosyltransferase [Longimicrobium sp.]